MISDYTKEKIFNIFIARFFLAFFHYLAGILFLVKGNTYKGFKSLCWINRMSYLQSMPFSNLSRKQIYSGICCIKDNNLILKSYMMSQNHKTNLVEYSRLDEGKKKSLKGNLLVLKEYNPKIDEKGVMILAYTNFFKDFFAVYNINEISQKYYIVLEPSTIGYYDPFLFMFINNTGAVIVQCSAEEDFKFIKSINSNLIPLKIGASHWVDLKVFYPIKNIQKKYDLIYVSNWSPVKRHELLFKALKILKNNQQSIKVALLGFTCDKRSKKDIVNMISTFGLKNMCEVYDRQPAEIVNQFFNMSRASILLSRREGSCRAIAESIAAGTPVLVYKRNIGGARNFVVSETGILFDYKELPAAILKMKENYKNFRPREWAEKNIGCLKATKLLNETIKKIAIRNNEPWTKNIKIKANSPDFVLKDENI